MEKERTVCIVEITVLSHWCGRPVNAAVEERYRYRLRRNERTGTQCRDDNRRIERTTLYMVHAIAHYFGCCPSFSLSLPPSSVLDQSSLSRVTDLLQPRQPTSKREYRSDDVYVRYEIPHF